MPRDDDAERQTAITLGPERMAAAIYEALLPAVRQGTFCQALVLAALTQAMLDEAGRGALAAQEAEAGRDTGRRH